MSNRPGTLAWRTWRDHNNSVTIHTAPTAFPDESWDWNKYRDVAIKLNEAKTVLSKSEAPSGEQPGVVYGRKQVRGYDRILQRLHQSGGNYVDPKDDRKCVLDAANAMRAL